MTCQDSFHEVAFNISFWTRNISSARILFWRGVLFSLNTEVVIKYPLHEYLNFQNQILVEKALRIPIHIKTTREIYL